MCRHDCQHVLLAQTKVGFLTGGRGRTFRAFEDTQKNVQREEACVRATVALCNKKNLQKGHLSQKKGQDLSWRSRASLPLRSWTTNPWAFYCILPDVFAFVCVTCLWSLPFEWQFQKLLDWWFRNRAPQVEVGGFYFSTFTKSLLTSQMVFSPDEPETVWLQPSEIFWGTACLVCVVCSSVIWTLCKNVLFSVYLAIDYSKYRIELVIQCCSQLVFSVFSITYFGNILAVHSPQSNIFISFLFFPSAALGISARCWTAIFHSSMLCCFHP